MKDLYGAISHCPLFKDLDEGRFNHIIKEINYRIDRVKKTMSLLPKMMIVQVLVLY